MIADEGLAAFLDTHVCYAVEQAAIYSSGAAVAEFDDINILALALFKFVAVTSRSVEAAERAEADFRKRVAVLGDAASGSAH